MNNLKTTDTGGFPLKLDDFRFVNNAVLEAFKGMMSMYDVTDSHAVILSGCARTSVSGTTSIAQGYISIGGEICFVPAHSYPTPSVGQNEYWMIDVSYDTSGNKTFQSTTSHNTYEVRVGKIQVSNTVPAGFTIYANTKNVFTLMKEGVGMFPGIIVMWGGSVSAIPSGWRLCDGTGGAPDLRSRFIIGYDSTNTANDTIGETGGNDEITLSVGQLPAHAHPAAFDGDPLPDHTHGIQLQGTQGGNINVLNASGSNVGTGSTQGASAGTPTGSVSIGQVGSGDPINIRPKYYTLAFLQKV